MNIATRLILYFPRAMLHEAQHFEHPYEFNPNRFLVDAKGEIRQDLEALVMDVFGFGRRSVLHSSMYTS